MRCRITATLAFNGRDERLPSFSADRSCTRTLQTSYASEGSCNMAAKVCRKLETREALQHCSFRGMDLGRRHAGVSSSPIAQHRSCSTITAVLCMQALRGLRLVRPLSGGMLLPSAAQPLWCQPYTSVPQLISLRDFGRNTCTSNAKPTGGLQRASCSSASSPRCTAASSAVLQPHLHQQQATPAVTQQASAAPHSLSTQQLCDG